MSRQNLREILAYLEAVFLSYLFGMFLYLTVQFIL